MILTLVGLVSGVVGLLVLLAVFVRDPWLTVGVLWAFWLVCKPGRRRGGAR